MSISQDKILNRLLDKLTAVRATLKKDERAMLDTMVLNANIMTSGYEVMQHGLEAGVTPAAEAGLEAGAVTPRMDYGPDEVIQHGLEAGVTPAAEAGLEAGAVTPRMDFGPDEVIQHGLEAGVTPAAEAGLEAGAVTPRMDFGPDEVIQHGLKEGVTPAAEAGLEAGAMAGAAQFFKIRLDEASEEYKLAD
jgi:hypothetical protein